MSYKTVLTAAILAAATLVSAFAAEPVIEFKANKDGPRTAGMCGPTHDEEVIFGLGSDGKEHYFAVGTDVRGQGITIWQSDDLVNWKDVGKVFTRENAPKLLNYGPRGWNYEFNAVKIDDKGEYEFLTERAPGANNYRLGSNQPFWAPCVYFDAANKTYYLYYSCSAYGTRNSFIGCAKSKSLDKGWEDCGQLIHTRTGDGKLYNAIDPTVFQDADGKLWMIYGSFFGGIAIVELDPKDPSKLLHPGTHGRTVASRGYEKVYEQDGFQGNPTTSVSGEKFSAYGIEGASIAYNPFTEYYYLFVSYDRLDWTYHVRVGRSKNVEGPYLDYLGRPLMYDQEKQGPDEVNGTKLIGPYRWKSTGAGWVGTGHSTLFKAHGKIMFGSNSKWQGTPGSFLGLRRVFWTKDGWPLLSPGLYAGEDMKIGSGEKLVDDELIPFNTVVEKDGIVNSGDSAQWDFIVFSVTDDTTFRRIDESTVYTLKADGTLEGGGKWEIGTWNSEKIIADGRTKDGRGFGQTILNNGVSMSVELPDGVKADGVCAYGWDQDRKCQTVYFTGLTDKGVAVWGMRGIRQ